MNVTDPKQVSAVLRECSLEHDSVEPLSSGGLRVQVTSQRHSHSTWTYGNLVKAAALLGTTDINFEWVHAGPGGDLTPSDPAEFCVYIGVGPVARHAW